LTDLEAELRSLDSDERASAVARLRELVATFSPADRELADAGADELFAMLDEELESQG